MPEEQNDKERWEVVCVSCLRIKREGRWTLAKATSLAGKSTGFCDECFDRERQSVMAKRKR